MNNKKATFSNITIGQIIELDFEAFNGLNKCRMSLVQIGKKFVSHILDINLCECEFNEVRNKFTSETGNFDVSENENEFYKYIADYYLRLNKEPIDKVLEYFYHSQDDINKIRVQLKYIDSELKKLEDKKKTNGWLNGEERYERNLLEYYRNKNNSAKNEILKFMSEDIERYALQNCTNHPFPSSNMLSWFIGRMPYQYSRGLIFNPSTDPYDVRDMTEMSNKFLDFPPESYIQIKNLYKTNKEEFYAFAKEYISGDVDGFQNEISKIEKIIEQNHIIANRKAVISTIIRHYQNKDFISVVNMLPMQIEGIFHDICLEVGIDESRLDISSINEKLRIIQLKIEHFIYFEYYSFKFPIIRNVVAHGKLIEFDIEQAAIMLMLDLLPVCELAMSEEIPIIKKIKLLEKLLKDDFSYFPEYFEFSEVTIPDFYKLDTEIGVVEGKYNSLEFWEYLKAKVKKEKIENIDRSDTMSFIRKIHGRKICKDKSSEFMKNLPILINEMKEIELERKKRIEPFLRASKRSD
ncbi:hypothetical protein J1779_08310 [Rahnella sp. FC061912-K]|uniref:hypothetical protein n=1 Tax=Rahnella rivi TaxID=2816249 RepID=UPI001C26B6EA|nr:hypothetical protein [Rahnella rivi]MBU9829935.1 hypothetical protein [Rahnella rivi]